MAWPLLVTFLFSHLLASAEVQVELRPSRMLGLFDFAFTIIGDPHHSPTLKAIFDQSPHNQPSLQPLLGELGRLREELELGYEFRPSLGVRRAGQDLYTLFLIQSIHAADLPDFSSRTTGLLPVASHRRLLAALEQLAPIYDSLVWNAGARALERQARQLQELAAKRQLNALFAKAAAFYGAQWPEGMPFVIGLYPVPWVEGVPMVTAASSLGAAEIMGINLVEENVAGAFGVLFHELCHSLYEAQPIEKQRELARLFQEAKGPHARYAHNWLNEALATALGNGWAVEALSGEPNGKKWYNNPYIDGFAKAIFPDVKAYVSESKPIDAALVAKIIGQFQEQFPEAPLEFANLFDKLNVLVADASLRQQTRRSFRSLFRTSSMDFAHPADDPKSIRVARANGHTLVVVASPGQQKQLEGLAKHFPELRGALAAPKKDRLDFIYTALGANGRAFIVINAASEAVVRKGFEELKRMGKLNPQRPLLAL